MVKEKIPNSMSDYMLHLRILTFYKDFKTYSELFTKIIKEDLDEKKT